MIRAVLRWMRRNPRPPVCPKRISKGPCLPLFPNDKVCILCKRPRHPNAARIRLRMRDFDSNLPLVILALFAFIMAAFWIAIARLPSTPHRPQSSEPSPPAVVDCGPTHHQQPDERGLDIRTRQGYDCV